MNMKNKLIKSILIFAAWAIPVLLLAWFAYTLIQNTKTQPQEKNQEIQITVNFNNKPVEGTETVETTRQVPAVCPFSGETKTSEVKTVVKTTKSEPSERRVVITEDAFKETMQQVAYTARLEAQNEYDKNFTTLLTILTIFGIAWPVIIGFAQYKFSERELKKIDDADKLIKQSTSDANNAIKLAEDADKKLNEASKIATEANDRAEKINAILKKTQCESYSSLSDLYSHFARHIDEDSNMSKNEFEDYCLFRAIYFQLKCAEYNEHSFQPFIILALKNLLSKEESTLKNSSWILCMRQAEVLLHECNIKDAQMIIDWLNEIKPEIKDENKNSLGD